MNCAHGPCTCEEAPIQRDGQGYCCEECANDARQQSANAGECRCPHPDCQNYAMNS